MLPCEGHNSYKTEEDLLLVVLDGELVGANGHADDMLRLLAVQQDERSAKHHKLIEEPWNMSDVRILCVPFSRDSMNLRYPLCTIG
jgi:hypothetical protein